MFDRFILSDKSFRNLYEKGERVGFIVNARISYYRGIPLSMVHDVKVTVDGETFGTDAMTFVVNGRRYTFKEMNEISNVNWHFGDYMRIEISKPGGLVPGKKSVEMVLTLRNSYFGVFEARTRRTMTFA